MMTVAIYNMKGGVGKTTTAVNVAYLAASAGQRTLLWDLDPQAAATFALRVRPKVDDLARKALADAAAFVGAIKETDHAGLDLLPSDFAYRKFDRWLHEADNPDRVFDRLLATIGREYDVIVLDCPPGFSLVTEGIFGTAQAVLVPALPTVLSLRTVVRAMKRAGRVDSTAELALFFNMVDRRKALHRRACDLASSHAPLFLSTSVPYASVVEQMGIRRLPLSAFAGGDPAAAAFAAIWRELHARLVGTRGSSPRWDLRQQMLEAVISGLEMTDDGHREARTQTGLRLLAKPADHAATIVHSFDTDGSALRERTISLELHERAGCFFLVIAAASQRAKIQVDASWARDLLSGVMSPVAALGKRADAVLRPLLEQMRTATDNRRLCRIESRSIRLEDGEVRHDAGHPTAAAPSLVRQAG